MIVPDWIAALLSLLGLKDSPAKAKEKEIANCEIKLRELRKKIDQNDERIRSFQADLNELDHEKKQFMEKYKALTDPTQQKLIASNFETAEKKIKTISHEITLLQKNNDVLFAEEKTIKTILADLNGPDIAVLDEELSSGEDAKENIGTRTTIAKELEKTTEFKDEPVDNRAIEQAFAGEITRDSSVSAIEKAIAEEAKKEPAKAEAVEQ